MTVRPNRRCGYTILELFFLMALVAIGVALFVELRRKPDADPPRISSIVLANDGTRVIAAFSDGRVIAWNLANGSWVGEFWDTAAFEMNVLDRPVVASPDGRFITRTVRTEPVDPQKFQTDVQVCDLQTERELLRLPDTSRGSKAISSDGKRLAIADCAANELRIVDVGDSKKQLVLAPLESDGPRSEMVPGDLLMFTNNDRDVLRWSITGELAKWNLETQTAVRRKFNRWRGPFAHWAVSPDSSRLLLVSTMDGATLLQLLDTTDFSDVQTASVKERVFSTAFVEDGKSLALVLLNELAIRDAASLDEKKKTAFAPDVLQLTEPDPLRQHHSLKNILFDQRCVVGNSARGPVVVAAGDQQILILNNDEWSEVMTLKPAAHRQAFLWGALPLVCVAWWIVRRRRARGRMAVS